MKPNYKERVGAIAWNRYQSAYGNSSGTDPLPLGSALTYSIPAQLVELASPDLRTALAASNMLWAGLCHQNAYLASAALPAIPFLLEVLETAAEPLTIEILEIFVGFVECLSSRAVPNEPWVDEIRAIIAGEHETFSRLTNSKNGEIARISQDILSQLRGTTHGVCQPGSFLTKHTGSPLTQDPEDPAQDPDRG